MGTERATTTVKAPALYHVRARQRTTSKVLGLVDTPSCPSTPPLRSRVTVPFLWEERSLSSPSSVLRGPYVGGGGRGDKPPRPLRTVSCRRKLGAGGGAFSWSKARAASAGDKKDGGHDHVYDASCCSPAPSSSASSSASSASSSMSYFFNVHSRGSGHWQQGDGRDEQEDGDNGAMGSVRITRFRRNRSLPNISTSHLWASIRKGVKQISPWS